MSKKLILALFVGMLATVLVGGCGSGDGKADNKPTEQVSAQNNTTAPKIPVVSATQPQPQVAKAAKADYSGLLTVAEVESITNRTNLSLKSIDSKKSGEAADLTYSTAKGERIVMVEVLRGSDFDRNYKEYCGQDFKPWPDAFWGPKATNPPTMLWFRKGDTLIMISCDYDSKNRPYITPGMLENIARNIRSRL